MTGEGTNGSDPFDDIVAGFGADDSEHETVPEIPDDISGLFGGADAEPPLTLFVTGLRSADIAVGLAVLAGVSGSVFDTAAGGVIVPDDSSATATEQAARAIGEIIGALTLLVIQKDAGVVTGRYWRAGEPGDDVSIGQVIAVMPAEIEDLVLGVTSVRDIPGLRRTDDVTRNAAVKMIAKGLRRRGKGQ